MYNRRSKGIIVHESNIGNLMVLGVLDVLQQTIQHIYVYHASEDAINELIALLKKSPTAKILAVIEYEERKIEKLVMEIKLESKVIEE